ncbi:REP-associated tyrosine transposase [Leisingera sp. McT4-56]|uniref:REP-associated tyrosine transposase n=1 Tax=Leisingera sp. McT4-56 TaxID=2881255 RepID=UPI001CF875CE|nr:transposase [Leisingera sp. McT4-56]MCB4456120.1 transposase [Leisingera sp. McT4-56]
MPNYRRFKREGGCYFFTINLAQRDSSLLVGEIAALRTAYAKTLKQAPFRCDAIVVLPDHLHAVWTLPAGDSGFSERWRLIKSRFSHAVEGSFGRSASKQAKREKGIWQRRYWEHLIRDEEDYRRHVAYCWANPVKHGLAERPADWAFSSIHRDIRAGRVAAEWAERSPDGAFGE